VHEIKGSTNTATGLFRIILQSKCSKQSIE